MNQNSQYTKIHINRINQPSFKSILIAIIISAAILIAGLILVYKIYGDSQLKERSAVTISYLTATVSIFPLLVLSLRLSHSRIVKFFILAWWPLKGLFLALAPPEWIAISGGDWIGFHQYGVWVSTYWNESGDFFIPIDLLQAYGTKYPIAAYFYGIPFFVFGNYSYTVIPWQGYLQLITALLAWQLMKSASLNEKASTFALIFMLYDPLWLTITNVFSRDIFIMLGLLVFMLGVLWLIDGLYIKAITASFLGLFVTAFSRDQYLSVLICYIVGLFIVAKSKRYDDLSKKKLFKAILIILAIIFTISSFSSLYFKDLGNIIDRTLWHYSRSSGIIDTGSGSLLEKYGQLKGYLLPIAIPVRIIAATVAPFPWEWENVKKFEYESNLYVVFHYVQSILHTMIAIFVFKRIWHNYRYKQFRSFKSLLLLCLGGALTMAMTLSWTGFNRYLLPAWVFFTPYVIDEGATAIKWVISFFWALFFVGMLHGVYYLLR